MHPVFQIDNKDNDENNNNLANGKRNKPTPQPDRVECGNDDGVAVTAVATFEHVHSILVVARKRT